MKRSALLRHLRKHGCCLKREGRSHSLWTNPATGGVEATGTGDTEQCEIAHIYFPGF